MASPRTCCTRMAVPRRFAPQYLVGCDGAHSVVRSALGLEFEGGMGMFPQLFMLGDVDVDWSMPRATCCASSGSRTRR